MNRNLLVLPLLLVLLLAACSEEISSEEHLAKARILAANNASNAAIKELKAALLKDPDNAEARAELGKIYFNLGHWEDAEKELSIAYREGASRVVGTPLLAQVLLATGEYQRLEELTGFDLDAEGKSALLAAKGLAELYQGDLVSAEEVLRAANSTEVVSPYARVALARLSMAEGNLAETRKRLKAFLRENEEYMPAWNLLGDVESAEMRPQAAMRAYSRALALDQRAFDARLNRALMFIYLENYPKARRDLTVLHQQHGSVTGYHPGYQFALGLLELLTGRYTQARKPFEKASEFSDAYPQTLYYLAVIDWQEGMFERSTEHIYQFLGLVPDSVAGAKLAARIELYQGWPERSEAFLRPVLQRQPNDEEALNLMAMALIEQGKHEEGIDYLNHVVDLDPEAKRPRVRLGAGLMIAGEENRAMATLRQLLVEDPAHKQAGVLIVLYYLERERAEEALQAAREYVERNPDTTTAYQLLAKAYLLAGDELEARRALWQVLELEPANPMANNNLAVFALAEGDYDRARQFYLQVLQEHPEHIPTLMKLAESYGLQGRAEAMLESLDKALLLVPFAPEPRLLKIRYFIGTGELERATALFDELTAEQQARSDSLAALAAIRLAAGRYEQALVTVQALLELEPDRAQHYFLRARAFAGQGERERMIADLGRVIELEPSHLYARIARARLAFTLHMGKSFQRRLRELQAEAPDNEDVLELEIAAAIESGDTARALELLERVYQRRPVPENLVALSRFHEARDRPGQAIAVLSDWLERHPEDVFIRGELASLYLNIGDIPTALQVYREILQRDSGDLVALANLAWYLAGEQPEQALAYAEEGVRRYPLSGPLHDTLAVLHLNAGRVFEARRNIDRALALSPADREIRLRDVQISLVEDEADIARKSLQALLQDHPEMAQRAEAVAAMRELGMR